MTSQLVVVRGLRMTQRRHYRLDLAVHFLKVFGVGDCRAASQRSRYGECPHCALSARTSRRDTVARI